MAHSLSMHGRKKLATIQAEFSTKFPYLTLLFLDKRRRAMDSEQTLAAVRTTKGEDLSIVGHMKVATFEARCLASFGITVEVAYLKDGELVRSRGGANEKTLSGLNAWCAEQGYTPIGGAKPARKSRDTAAQGKAKQVPASDDTDEALIDQPAAATEERPTSGRMTLIDPPASERYFDSLPVGEQAKMVFHAKVLSALIPTSDYRTDSLALSTFRLFDLSDALLSATSSAGDGDHLWAFVHRVMKGELREQSDFEIDRDALDTYVVAECVVHAVLLALAAGRTPAEVLTADWAYPWDVTSDRPYLQEMLSHVLEDDTGWGTRTMRIRPFLLMSVLPLLQAFFTHASFTVRWAGSLAPVGQAIDATKIFLES